MTKKITTENIKCKTCNGIGFPTYANKCLTCNGKGFIKKITTELEDRFDKLFPFIEGVLIGDVIKRGNAGDVYGATPEQVKSFIRTEIDLAKKQSYDEGVKNERERIVNMIREVKVIDDKGVWNFIKEIDFY